MKRRRNLRAGALKNGGGRISLALIVATAFFAIAPAGARAGVSITSPADGGTVSGQVRITARADSGVQWINLYVDGTYLVSSPPYNFSWNSATVADGQHTLLIEGFAPPRVLVAQASVTVNVSNNRGGGNPTPATLGTLPPGSKLPTDAQCASLITYSAWEPRSENAVQNHTQPPANWLASFHAKVANGEGGAPGSFLQRVDGQFSGTTDEILQWAACKWGFDVNVVRAIAVNESHWFQNHVGDNGVSYGIVQVKTTDGNYPSTMPYARDSTAFNVDYKLAQQRACFEGKISYLDSSSYPDLGNVDYMLWGCVGQWYSGQWYDGGAQSYIQETKGDLASRVWAQPDF